MLTFMCIASRGPSHYTVRLLLVHSHVQYLRIRVETNRLDLVTLDVALL